MEQCYSLEKLTAGIGMEQFLKQYVDVERFLTYCRQCGNYNTVWSCPPYDFDPISLWQKYQRLELHGRRLRFSAAARARTYDPEQLQELLEQSLYAERAVLTGEILELEARRPGSRALLPGNCRFCGEHNCGRSQGLPCRHPEQMRPSIESLGGDVSHILADLLDSPLDWIKEGRLPACLTLAAALLLPAQPEN